MTMGSSRAHLGGVIAVLGGGRGYAIKVAPKTIDSLIEPRAHGGDKRKGGGSAWFEGQS